MNLFVRTCNYSRMNTSRVIARIVAGLWIVLSALALIGAVTGDGYGGKMDTAYITMAIVPLLIGLAVFVLAFFYEVLAAVIAWAVSAALLVWGLVGSWEAAQWLFMLVVVIGPMAIAGFLFFLASQTQKVCSLEEAGE
jgi:hypothetical protein